MINIMLVRAKQNKSKGQHDCETEQSDGFVPMQRDGCSKRWT